MTREEEALNNLDDLLQYGGLVMSEKYIESIRIAAIELEKTLKREPCEDAISRKDALSCFTMCNSKDDAWNRINKLSKIAPKKRIGRWITDRCDMYKCSICGHTYTDLSNEKDGMNYCPNCGAEMVEPQESEE